MNRTFSIALLLSLLCFLMAGCGGGGGSPSTGKLVYKTDWTNRSRSVTGLSQRVQIFDLSNRLVDSISLNQDFPSEQVVQMGSHPTGTYRLHIELFSQRDLGGIKTGEIDTYFLLSGTRNFLTAVGEDPTTVAVTPSNATMQVQVSKQFLATAYAAPGRAVFSAPGNWEWSELGSHASVTNAGLALGLSAGSGSIRARHIESGLQNSATYTVEPFEAVTKKWTVLVFMNAANDLYPFSTLNMNQLESVAQNPDVRVLVQWKQSQSLFSGSTFDGTRRYLVKPDSTSAIASQLLIDMGLGVDMGQPETLNDFIEWANTYYPGERTVLIVWNHGNGWRQRPIEEQITRAVSYDDETGNAIQIWELAQAFGDNHFDILAWDASLMQMMEVAYEAKDHATYVVGSEESPPGEGYPYDLIFDDFRDRPDDTTLNLAKEFVNGMLAVPEYQSRKITQSVIETAKLSDLATSLNSLANELIANETDLTAAVQTVRSQAQSYSPTTVRVYRDLIDITERLEALSSISSVDLALADVRAKAQAAVVFEGHNTNSSGSRGIAIDWSSADVFSSSSKDYGLLRFAADTNWNEWLSTAP